MTRRPEIDALVKRHQLLDKAIYSRRAHFLSDWNCENPYASRLLGPELSGTLPSGAGAESYIYFDEEEQVKDSIRNFHLQHEALKISDANVIAGPGSSTFLAAFSLWLQRAGYTEIYYLPPLYHTFHFLLQSLDVSVTPISTKHAFEAGFRMNLPSRHTVLLMCDPIWYAGKYVPAEHLEAIAEWQKATASLVFVDGSFQYIKWNHALHEASAALDPELTFRLVCPAKALAVPFLRFAYLLHPTVTHEDLMFLYESMVGGASASDLAFAHRALAILSDPTTGSIMPTYFRDTYGKLVTHNLIETTIEPECGYFVFGVPRVAPPDAVVMDGSYFELRGFPDYCRINLMKARRILAARGEEPGGLA